MRFHSITIVLAAVASCWLPAFAEIENTLAPRDILLAVDHSTPDQIGPTLHHLHEPEDLDHFEFEFSAGVDSRYVSEGRNNLAGQGGIFWGNAIGHFHALGGSIFGEATGIVGWEADYQELGLTAGYEFEAGPVVLSGTVTYLWFPADEADDVEFAVAAEWVSSCGVGLAAEWVWSTEADGWFGEAQMFYEWEVHGPFSLVPSIFIGMNQGYVADEHDGWNHFGGQLAGAYHIRDNVELSAYVAALTPINEREGDSLGDLFWFGGAVTMHF